MRTDKVILIKGAVETLEYFSGQMGKYFENRGISVFFWDMKAPLKSREQFIEFVKGKKAVLITFNFIGLCGESQFEGEGISLWEQYGVSCCCIMVDHPMYYYRQLREYTDITIVCIDRDHQRFVETYYKKYNKIFFLPLAGTRAVSEDIPYRERTIDVLFTGNYVPEENLICHLKNLDEETKRFYFDMADTLIAHPQMTMEEVIIPGLVRAFGPLDQDTLMNCMHHMIFVDLYVRSYFRREIVCSLAENGVKITVVGKDWEKCGCKRPDNIVMAGQKNSYECLQYLGQSKIALNIMPWFKDGAHDRVFNGMLQKCAVVTDTSRYMEEALREGVEYIKFTLEKKEELCGIIMQTLDHSERAEKIALAGYEAAGGKHTWRQRADALLDVF